MLNDVEQQVSVQQLADSVHADLATDASPTTLGMGATGLLEGNSSIMDKFEDEVSSPSAKRALTENQVSVSRDDVQERARMGTTGSTSSLVKHPDFNGTWKMVECEGDFDAFMKEMGVAWALRKAAQAVNYGCGSTYHTVEQNRNRIKIETKNPKGTFTKDFNIDGSEQDDIDPVEKKELKVVPYWETVEDRLALTVEAYMPMPKGDARKFPLTRRYMRETSMVVEQVSPRGVRIRRIFHKQ